MLNPFTTGIQQAIVGAAALAVAGLLVVVGVQRLQIGSVRLELSAEQNARITDREAATTAALKESARIRAEEAAGRKKLQEALDDERKKTQAARADAAISDAAAGRLRDRVAAIVAAAREAARNPGVAPGSPPADDASGMLSDVLGRCVTRVRQLADIADARGIAGSTCERAYDALSSSAATTAPDASD